MDSKQKGIQVKVKLLDNWTSNLATHIVSIIKIYLKLWRNKSFWIFHCKL